MKSATIAGIAGVGAVVLAFSAAQPLANGPAVTATAEEIAQALRGKICTSRVGATFAFGLEGRYTYDGLWQNGGQYTIGDGVVTVTFDSGLKRSFTISWHDSIIYMEETALRCRTPAPVQS